MSTWQRHLPAGSFPPLAGLPEADWLAELYAQPLAGSDWEPVALSRRYADVAVPILHLGGWFDEFLCGTVRAFQGIRAHARSAHVRASQRLVIGPWVHGPGNVGQRAVGEVDFGSAATEISLNAHRLAWYDRWLKGVDNGADRGPPVRVFLMGGNRWLELDDWPPPNARATPVYFRAGTGRTEASLNNGGLSLDPPGDEPPDGFDDDPDDPVPSLRAGLFAGPCDHRPVEGRMLTYTSAPLERDLTIAGPVKAVLWGASSAPDTDWVVRLCDVWPDGRSMSVCDGILRGRYRHGLDTPTLLEPGRPERFEVDLVSTAQLVRRGAPPPRPGGLERLPALRAQPAHRRASARRDGWSRRSQHGLPRRGARLAHPAARSGLRPQPPETGNSAARGNASESVVPRPTHFGAWTYPSAMAGSSVTFSLRMDEGTHEHLLARAGRTGASASQLVNRYVKEGLRMDEHPGVGFVTVPDGERVPVLAGRRRG